MPRRPLATLERGRRVITGIMKDLRFGIRCHRRHPTVTLAAAVSLGLGIGAVTLVFSIANTLLLRPIPGVDPRGLHRIEGASVPLPPRVASYREFTAIADGVPAFEGVAAERVNSTAVAVGGSAMSVGAAVVSDTYFGVLGVEMQRGAGFGGLDREHGPAQPLVVVSDGFWRTALGADTDVIGRGVRINGMDFTISGVTRPGFVGAFPGFRVQLWAPLWFTETVFPNDGSIQRMEDRFLNLFGRIAPGGNTALAQAQLAAVAEGFSSAEGFSRGRTYELAKASGIHPSLKGVVSVVMAVILAVTSLVLFVACANVANLLLARGVERGPEIATRLALGASGSQLVRQLLVEATVLGLLGALLGVFLSVLGGTALSRFQPPVGVPVGFDIALDLGVLLFAAAVGFTSSLVFGILPAVRGLRRGRTTLTQGWAAKDDSGRAGLLRNALVVAQIAVTCMLLVTATLFLESVGNLATLDAGFDRGHVVTAAASPDAYDEDQGRVYWHEVLEATRATPGVQAADLGLFVHLGGRADQARVHPSGLVDDPASAPFINYSIIGRGLLDVLGIALESGRGFALGDGDGPPVIIVNQALAGLFWPDRNPIGQTIHVDVRGTVREVEVVGVARTVKYRRFNESPTPFFYLPFAQWYRPDMVVHARVAANPAGLPRDLSDRLMAIDPGIPVTTALMSDHTTMEVFLARSLRTVLSLCALMALVIATVGVAGVVWYAASRRAKEVAIRMALGAPASKVRRSMIRQMMIVVAIGIGIGVAVLIPTGQLVARFMYGVSPRDLGTTVAVSATLMLIGLTTSWISVRRATRLRAFQVLREDT